MVRSQTAPSLQAVPAQANAFGPAARHIRDSSMLVMGRVLAQGLDFGTQILLVHYLSKADFGAFSYALSIVMLFKSLVVFELPDTLSRFIPIYRERKQFGAILGGIIMAVGVVTGLAVLALGGINIGVLSFNFKPTDDPQALRLLVLMAFLIPLEGLDGLLAPLLATFGGSRLIFVRQSLFTPVLRILTVLAFIALQAPLEFLIGGYLLIDLLGVAIYAFMLRSVLGKQGFLRDFNLRQIIFPFREIFGFATPLLTSTLVWLLMESGDALMLGHFQGSEAVAAFRAVLPVARLNQGVILTFALLYTPLAAQLYARNERAELADLYSQTAVWMTILTFPIFVLSFSFARSLTIGLFGPQYADSASIMALLSLGYFFQTSTGFNGLTLKTHKKIRYAVSVDLAAAALNIAINLILVPRLGPFGAGIGTAGTMIVHNLLKQYGLWRYTGITLLQRQCLVAYATVFALSFATLGLQSVLPVSIWIALPLGALASLVLVWANRDFLQVDKMFPEFVQLPILRVLLRPFVRAS